MWAEKLFDGSFEGLSPYKVAYLKETDFRERPWYPSGETNRAKIRTRSARRTSAATFPTKSRRSAKRPARSPSLRMESPFGGAACDFACFFKQSGLSVKVRACGYIASPRYTPSRSRADGGMGQVHRANSSPRQTDANATLTIEFRGPDALARQCDRSCPWMRKGAGGRTSSRP